MSAEELVPTLRFDEIALYDRPQERLERHGATALSDTELLAMILRRGTRGSDVISLASDLIRTAGSLHALLQMSMEEFMAFPGIGRVRALQLVTLMEIARRAMTVGLDGLPVLDQPDKVFSYLRPMAIGLDVEKFWVLSLNRKNRLIRGTIVTSGTATASLVHPREVFREAIRRGASAVICAHNHPSGDPSPSAADMRVTRQLRDAAHTLQIDLLDHVVLGDPKVDPQGPGYYSFADQGLI